MIPVADFSKDVRRINDDLYTAFAPQGWGVYCREESLRDGGQFWPKEHGLTQVKGNQCCWIVEPSQVDDIYAARQIAEKFGLTCGWSVGSAARQLLKYVGPGQYPYKGMLRLTGLAGHNYLDCTPGKYPDCTLYDVKSYYYSLLRRLPSWHCFLTSQNALRWLGEAKGMEDRRWAVLDAVRDLKPLRNALVGCMLGKTSGMPYYHRGERLYHKGGPGLFRGVALCIVRSAWEMTRIASEQTESFYSNVDCVVTMDGLYPSVWTDHALTVAEKATGRAEICSPISYKVGGHQTKIYAEGSRFKEPLLRPSRPEHEYYRDWVGNAA